MAITITIREREGHTGTPYRDVYISGDGLGVLSGCAGVIKQVEGGWLDHPNVNEPIFDSAEMAALSLVGKLANFCPQPSMPRLGNAL